MGRSALGPPPSRLSNKSPIDKHKRGGAFFCFLLPVGLSGTTVLRPQLRLLQGSPCHSLTLGFEPGTSCMRVRSASHYATGAAPERGAFGSRLFKSVLLLSFNVAILLSLLNFVFPHQCVCLCPPPSHHPLPSFLSVRPRISSR